MKTKKVESEEVKKNVSCESCGSEVCNGSNCMTDNRCGWGCGRACYGRPCRGWGWRIFSVFFRMILMLIILSVVFALGAVVGGAGAVKYMNGEDFVFGPGMMREGGMTGDWDFKSEQLFGSRAKGGRMMIGGSLDGLQVNSPVRIFGNIVEVRSGELTISDNSGKNVDVVSGSFTIIETSKGEIGIKDLKVDEGVTVYGALLSEGAIKASNIRVSR